MKILINQASFSLPCKTFLISFSTTKKRPLPVVKEFVVRLIFSLDECKPEIIQQFFGFNDTELQAVLNDLSEERLIVWETEYIRLSKYAEERFEKINGQMLPRFFEIEDMTESVSFDLHSFKILYAGLSSTGRNPTGIDVPLPAKNYSDMNSKIRSSFDDQFIFFQEKIKNINIFNDSIELYKINHIISRYDHILPIEVNFFISADRGNNIVVEYANKIVDEWDNQHELFKSIDYTLLRNSDENCNMIKNLNTYLSITRDPFISKFFANNELDISTLINLYGSSSYSIENKSEKLIIGNLYTENNIEIISDMIKDNKHNDRKSSGHGTLWFATPDKKTWGRTNSIINFSTLIKSHLDHRKKTSEVVLILPCGSTQEAMIYDQRYFESDIKFQGCSESFGNENIEILLIPDFLAITLFHLPVKENMNLTIPIGYVTIDKEKISKITQNVASWAKQKNIFTNYFEKRNSDKENSILNRVIIPSLDLHKPLS